ncbi:MAG: helix-turn-helix transcriptional regulator [Arenicellales bacterium]
MATEMLRDVREFNLAINDEDETIPGDIVDRLMHGESPVAVWRSHRGLKSSELAAKSNLTSSYVSMIEAGKREPSVKSLKAIASALDVDLDDLVWD